LYVVVVGARRYWCWFIGEGTSFPNTSGGELPGIVV
jgi:hypothetical protein